MPGQAVTDIQHQALIRAGLLPADIRFPIGPNVDRSVQPAASCDPAATTAACNSTRSKTALSLPAARLLQAWSTWRRLAPEKDRSRAVQMELWLRTESARGACLTFGLPGAQPSSVSEPFHNRLAWWPDGIPSGPRVAITGSRIGRVTARHADLFRTLRLACRSLADQSTDAQRTWLVTAAGTPYCDWIARCGRLFDLPLLTVQTCRASLSPTDWLQELVECSPGDHPDQHTAEVWLSPALPMSEPPTAALPAACVVPDNSPAEDRDSTNDCGTNAGRPDPATTLSSLPERDLAVSLLADQLWIASLRRHGNWHLLAANWLADPHCSPGGIRLLTGTGLLDCAVASVLQNSGAIVWHLEAAPEPTHQTTDHERTTIKRSNHSPTTGFDESSRQQFLAELLAAPPGDWLLHWTRAPQKQWPGESESDWRDAVLLDDQAAGRTALHTLRRIVHEELLRASSRLIRSRSPMVCLTAVPIMQLAQMRVYRGHRQRFDFEPYGIGLRRSSLCGRGVGPVIYGGDAVWESLAPADRPWFQFVQASAGSGIDWTTEREWRHCGDLAFGNIAPTDLFVWCPKRSEATELQAISRWPVIALEDLE